MLYLIRRRSREHTLTTHIIIYIYMRRKASKANLSFMWGIMAMAIVVLLVAGLFLYLCVPAK